MLRLEFNCDLRANKDHLVEAGKWIHKNLPNDGNLFSNDRIVVHYASLGPKSNFADRFTNARMQEHLDSGMITDYRYVALSINQAQKDEVEFRNKLLDAFGSPKQVLTGTNGRSVMIFAQ